MVESLTATQLQERLRAESDVQLIDTRTAAKFAAEHLPGAENVPYPELAERIGDIEWGEEIVLVCERGESSLQAARILESYEGIDEGTLVANLEDGYEGWDGDLETE
jgi:rhodanese-related sulfurtransferase